MTASASEPRTRAAAAARWWPTLLGCLLLALAVYLPTALRADFVNFDDNFYFGPDNPTFQRGLWAVLDPRNLIANVYLPVAHASLWLDFKLGGGDPLLPHLTSLLLHALAAFALVRAFLQLGVGALPAHLAGALFLLHPALAETVAWVSSRKDVLAGLFVFIALGAAAKYARRPVTGRLVWIAGLTVLAMYSKATAVVLPLLLLLVALYVGGDRRRFLAPLVSLLVTLPIAWHHQLNAAAEGTMVQGGTIDRLAQAPGALLHYLATAFVPHGLNVLYPEVKTLAVFRSELLPGIAVLAALLASAAWLWRRERTAAAGFGVALLLVALLPFNTAFPASAIAAADRYLYLAVPGAALALAVLVNLLPRRVAVAGAVLPVLLLSLTLVRAPAFASSADLWRASLDADSDNAVAQINFVADLAVRAPFGAIAEKRAHLEAAVAAARYPIHELTARRRLLVLLLCAGDLDAASDAANAAIAAAERVLAAQTSPQLREKATEQQLLPTLLEAFEPLRQAKRFDAARACFQRAQAIAPTHPDVIAADALLQLQEVLGRDPAAIATDARAAAVMASLRALLAQPATEYHRGLNIAMGMWQAAAGNSLVALKYLRRAIAADPTASEAYVQAAIICRRNGLYDDAYQFAKNGDEHAQAKDPRLLYEKALGRAGQEGGIDDGIQFLEAYVATAPKDRDAARMLSSFLCSKAIAGMGDRPEAEQEQLIARALAYNPDEPRAEIIKGRICRNHRRFQEAVEHLERAHAALPAFDDAKAMLAQSYFDLGYQKRYEKPPDIDGAVAAWQKFLALDVVDLDPAGVRMQLEALWRSSEEEGVAKLKAGDRAAAAASFRRCLRIDGNQHWASWLLATALFDQPGTDLHELDQLLQQAIAWQQKNQLDRSRPVLLRVLTLQHLGQDAAAQQLGDDYLRAPDADADAEALRRLQRALAH